MSRADLHKPSVADLEPLTGTQQTAPLRLVRVAQPDDVVGEKPPLNVHPATITGFEIR